MKILNIMLSRGLGGIEQAFLDYSNCLESEGFKVIKITSIFAKINSVLLHKIISLPNLGPWDFLSIIYLKLIIKIIKPDLVIAHGRRAIKFTKFHPLIGVAHNYNISNLLKCDYIIALTSHMREHLIKQNFPAEKITIIPNMIKIDQEFTVRIFNKIVKIGACARFVKKKGIDILLQALAQLKKAGYLFEGIIGGEGEENEYLIKLCHDLGLNNEVKFMGWITDKKKFFQNIDIFCLPSLHEPFGIIILEAMKFSVPIISTKTEGPIEILEDQESAILVDKGSENALMQGLIYLISNPKKAECYARNAYNKVQNNYEDKKIAKKLTTFLQSIVNTINS